MTENNNPVVTTWFQQQQTPAGWFDLLVIMVEGMLNNAGELESQPLPASDGRLAGGDPSAAGVGDGGRAGGEYQPAADPFPLGRGDD